QACQVAVQAGRGTARAERMLALARPWLDLDLLESAGPPTLRVLFRDCLGIERELGCRRRRRLGAGPALALGLLVVGGMAAAWLWPLHDRLIARLGLAWRPVRSALKGVAFGEWLLVAAVAAAILGSLFIWRGRSR